MYLAKFLIEFLIFYLSYIYRKSLQGTLLNERADLCPNEIYYFSFRVLG